MGSQELAELISDGESEHLEFKRCGNKAEPDVFESICAFANSFGGTVLLGVEDDGTVAGISPDSAIPLMRNIVNVLNNPNAFDVPIAVEFDQLAVDGKTVVRVKRSRAGRAVCPPASRKRPSYSHAPRRGSRPSTS